MFAGGQIAGHPLPVRQEAGVCAKIKNGAKVLLHSVQTPELFGVAKVDKKNKIIQRMFDGYEESNEIDLVYINEKPMKGILFLLFLVFLPILIFIALQ